MPDSFGLALRPLHACVFLCCIVSLSITGKHTWTGRILNNYAGVDRMGLNTWHGGFCISRSSDLSLQRANRHCKPVGWLGNLERCILIFLHSLQLLLLL